jgi:D-alanyl-D-alanine carboxypeptidase
MKNFLLVVLSFFLCTTKVVAQTEVFAADTLVTDTRPWTERLKARMDSILTSPLLETTQLGLMVYDLTADSTVYTYNHRQRLRPASTMKLLTAITVLDRLGADYQLRTSLYITGRIAGNTLIGNVICVGGMDPMFDRTDMQAFVSQLRQMGIATIQAQNIKWDKDKYPDYTPTPRINKVQQTRMKARIQRQAAEGKFHFVPARLRIAAQGQRFFAVAFGRHIGATDEQQPVDPGDQRFQHVPLPGQRQ